MHIEKKCFFSYTVEGAETSAIIFCIVETAMANELDPYLDLRFLLEKLIEALKAKHLSFIPVPDFFQEPLN